MTGDTELKNQFFFERVLRPDIKVKNVSEE